MRQILNPILAGPFYTTEPVGFHWSGHYHALMTPPHVGCIWGGLKKHFLKIFLKLENGILSFLEILCIF